MCSTVVGTVEHHSHKIQSSEQAASERVDADTCCLFTTNKWLIWRGANGLNTHTHTHTHVPHTPKHHHHQSKIYVFEIIDWLPANRPAETFFSRILPYDRNYSYIWRVLGVLHLLFINKTRVRYSHISNISLYQQTRRNEAILRTYTRRIYGTHAYAGMTLQTVQLRIS